MKNVPENGLKQFSNLHPYSHQFYRKWIIRNIFLQVFLLSNKKFQFLPDPARKLSTNLYDIYHCYMYSEKLLIMYRGTV